MGQQHTGSVLPALKSGSSDTDSCNARVNFSSEGQPLDCEIVVEPLIFGILKARCSLKALDAFRSKLFRDRHGIHPECPGMNG